MKVLGKIKELYRKDYGYPSIKTLISDTPFEYQNEVVEYLKNGKEIAIAIGKANDVLTGARIPGEWWILSDGIYEWRDRFDLLCRKIQSTFAR